jgi:mRNA-degrading endonuclease RelE of RelBE toxin-antitoxin system
VTSVVVTPSALDDLDRLILTLSLPSNTRERVGSSLTALLQFPLLGAPLQGRWASFRFILGPWRWMLLVYDYDEERDRVAVVTIHDARSSHAATSTRS